MIKDTWLTRETFSVYLANRIRRLTSETNRDLSIHIFSDNEGLDINHVRRVLEAGEEPSQVLLEAVGAEKMVEQHNYYRFKR